MHEIAPPFVYPIADPTPIDLFPATLQQIGARISKDYPPEVKLVLFDCEPGWIFTLKHPDGHFSLARTNGIQTRIFRTLKALREVITDVVLTDDIEIPVNSERMRSHIKFIEDRDTWFKSQMKPRKLTTVKIGAELGVHNNNVSFVLLGYGHDPVIEDTLARHLGYDPADLFPPIPDQIM